MQTRLALVWWSFTFAALAVTGGCSGDESDPSNAELRIAIAAEPTSLDPALISDLFSANVVINLMDPLVRLDDDLEPEPALAESWKLSDANKTVTFRLRDDGRWSNGDRVTAADFEYAWKRILDPAVAADPAYQLYGIVGAAQYNGCERDCARLRDRVGVDALDDRTLEVRLTGPQPWFLEQVALTTFLPVHRATVERFGRKWTEPGNIVTNGPYRLTAWKHNESITLTKWEQWRGADAVSVERFAGQIIKNATTALTAFEAGEIDACLAACMPPDDVERLQQSDAYVSSPGLGTRYLELNLETVPDLNQRRALAFALDRTSLVEHVTQAGERPATSLTPVGMPGFDAIAQDFLPKRADVQAARRYLERASSPKRTLNLLYWTNDPAGGAQIAVAVQSMWEKLGLRTRVRGLEFQEYLALSGPPMDESVDVVWTGWIADFVDDINFLELLTCKPGNTNSYCDADYDRLIERARSTPNDAERHEIYAQAEAMLTGPSGALPVIPAYWATFPTIRRPGIEGWRPNLLGQYDFTKVTVADG
jgi:oligopeptide transport system substrate-binding protein